MGSNCLVIRLDELTRRAVFLDRDGVINQVIVRNGRPYPPATLRELKILPGVKEALQKLHDANYLLIVVSNQPDVARGEANKKDIELMNKFLLSQLPIDEFRICFHDDNDECACRKPRPGALLQAAKTYNIDLKKSFMIGDRWRDIEAGASAGCKTFFIKNNYRERQPDSPDYSVSNLLEAKKIILEELV